MIKSAQIIVALLGLGVIGTSSVPVTEGSRITLTPADPNALATTVYWPESVSVDETPVKRETDQERMARGLTPLAPKRRYTPTYQALRPRISPAPGSNTAATYGFVQCWDSAQEATNSRQTSVTSSDVQSAVDDCATFANPDANFGVFGGPGNWICITLLSNLDSVTCDSGNGGFYTRN